MPAPIQSYHQRITCSSAPSGQQTICLQCMFVVRKTRSLQNTSHQQNPKDVLSLILYDFPSHYNFFILICHLFPSPTIAYIHPQPLSLRIPMIHYFSPTSTVIHPNLNHFYFIPCRHCNHTAWSPVYASMSAVSNSQPHLATRAPLSMTAPVLRMYDKYDLRGGVCSTCKATTDKTFGSA